MEQSSGFDFKKNVVLIPFSVAIIDMDWHITSIPEELKDPDPLHSSGWTGFSWNKELFSIINPF